MEGLTGAFVRSSQRYRLAGLTARNALLPSEERFQEIM
jgi:hypothetical protein